MEVIDTTGNFQPDISLYGFRIGEPVITLTALLISVVCGYCWWRLRKAQSESDALKLTRLFFLFMGISTLIGGLVGHAFLYLLPFGFKIPGWLLGMVAASALAQASVARSEDILKRGTKRFFTVLNIGGFAVLFLLLISTLWFPIVEIHSAFSLVLIVSLLEAYRLKKLSDPGSRFILYGILLAVAAVSVHILKWSLSEWFTFFDIGHVFLCGTMWMIMRGAEVSVQND
jgi:hypothetical protein